MSGRVVSRTPAILPETTLQQRLIRTVQVSLGRFHPKNSTGCWILTLRVIRSRCSLVEDDAYSYTLYYVVSGEVILESGETIHARLVPGDHVGKLGFLGDETELGLRAKVSQASTLLAVDGAAIDAMTWADRSTIWATLCHINEMKHRYAHRLVEFTWFSLGRR